MAKKITEKMQEMLIDRDKVFVTITSRDADGFRFYKEFENPVFMPLPDGFNIFDENGDLYIDFELIKNWDAFEYCDVDGFKICMDHYYLEFLLEDAG